MRRRESQRCETSVLRTISDEDDYWVKDPRIPRRWNGKIIYFRQRLIACIVFIACGVEHLVFDKVETRFVYCFDYSSGMYLSICWGSIFFRSNFSSRIWVFRDHQNPQYLQKSPLVLSIGVGMFAGSTSGSIYSPISSPSAITFTNIVWSVLFNTRGQPRITYDLRTDWEWRDCREEGMKEWSI